MRDAWARDAWRGSASESDCTLSTLHAPRTTLHAPIALPALKPDFDPSHPTVKTSSLVRPPHPAVPRVSQTQQPHPSTPPMPRPPVERGTDPIRAPTDALAANAVRISEARYRTLIQAI